MRHLFTFSLEGMTAACLGAALVLGAGASAWGQQPRPNDPRGSTPSAGPRDTDPAAGQEPKRWMKEDFGHPAHESALNEERENAELLEVQILIKKAQIRAAEVRARNAKDSGEKEVLQAELDAERAELLEPQLHLSRTKKRIKELEDASKGGHEMMMGHPGMMGMGMMDHAGMMGMGHPGMMGHPMGHHWAMMRDLQIENNLNLLRVAVERLETEVDGLLDGSVKPGSVKNTTASDGSSGSSGSSKDTTRP
jgi:hypothetical protein